MRLCSLVIKSDNEYISIRLTDTDEYLAWAGNALLEDISSKLSEYGLVVLGLRTFQADVGTRFEYFGRSFQVTRKIECRANLLSSAGRELFALADPIPSPSYFDEVRKSLDGIPSDPFKGAIIGQKRKVGF